MPRKPAFVFQILELRRQRETAASVGTRAKGDFFMRRLTIISVVPGQPERRSQHYSIDRREQFADSERRKRIGSLTVRPFVIRPNLERRHSGRLQLPCHRAEKRASRAILRDGSVW